MFEAVNLLKKAFKNFSFVIKGIQNLSGGTR